MCDSGKGETFCERSKKEQSTRKISRCARNDGIGGWVYFTQRTTDMFGKRYSSQRHPERSRGIFLAHRYSVLCATAGKGNPSVKGARKSSVQGGFLDCTRNDGGGKMGLFYVAYNGYVWKALFLYRHPERSRGIFLAHWYSVLCETAEKGNPSAKEARKSRVQGRFLAALEMTVWGMDNPRSV